MPQQALIEHFSKIAATEKVEISPEALTLLARAADGSVRDGLSMLDQAIAHGGGVVDAAQVRDMLGLADRSRVLELFEKTMRGDAPSVVAALGEMHDSGADPVVILQDLLELTHWVTRLKVAPEAAAASADSERAQGLAMAGKLSMASLTRAWTLLLKGLQETLSAPSPLRAAEMALIRLCYAADLPSPSDAIKALQNGAAPAPLPSAGVAAPARARRWRRWRRRPSGAAQPRRRRGAASRPRRRPTRKSFTEIVALFEARREARLVHHLMHHVHEVRCEPGLIEFRPAAQGAARPGAAPQRASEPMDRPALDRHGVVRRRQADARRAEGGQGRRAAQPGREQSAGAGHPEDLPRRQARRGAAQGRAGLAGGGPGRGRRRTAGRRGVSCRRRHPGKRVLMFDKLKDLGGLMQQAQAMQQKMQELQATLERMEIVGSSGAGLVKVTVNGKNETRKVEIDASLFVPADKGVVEDLIVAAANDARTKVEQTVQEQMRSITGGLPLPPGFKL